MTRSRDLQASLFSVWTPIAIAQASLWFFALPLVCRPVWASFWSQFSPRTAEVLLNSTGLLLFLGYSLCALPLYYLQLPFFEQYKISDRPWPWRADQPQATRSAFWALARRSVILYLFNNLLLVPAVTAAKYHSVDLLGMQQLDFTDDAWPSQWTMLWQNLLLTLVHEFLFYSAHRIMHHPKFYYYHKVHHEYKQNIILASQHEHPVDYVLSLAGPAAAATLIVRPHSFVQFQWVIWLMLANFDDHLGYAFPWSAVRWFPLAGLTEHHEFHHAINMGCFASKLNLYDRLFNSEHKYLQWKAKRADKIDKTE